MARSNRELLREQYAGAVEAVPDTLVTLERSPTLHLPARDRDGPACSSRPGFDWFYADTEDALRFGGALCESCFKMYLELLARDDDTPVARLDTDADAQIDADAEVVTRIEADGGRSPLTSVTERVARVTGSSTVYHAPTASGALCGAEVNKTDERELLPQYRPCEVCFDVDREEE